ncbi:uncharacterized protein ISCGN_032075 [Ixodes scapularis]
MQTSSVRTVVVWTRLDWCAFSANPRTSPGHVSGCFRFSRFSQLIEELNVGVALFRDVLLSVSSAQDGPELRQRIRTLRQRCVAACVDASHLLLPHIRSAVSDGIPVDSQQLVNLVCCTQMLLRELVKCRALLVANRMEMRDFAEPAGSGVTVLDKLVLWRPPPKDYHVEELRAIDRDRENVQTVLVEMQEFMPHETNFCARRCMEKVYSDIMLAGRVKLHSGMVAKPPESGQVYHFVNGAIEIETVPLLSSAKELIEELNVGVALFRDVLLSVSSAQDGPELRQRIRTLRQRCVAACVDASHLLLPHIRSAVSDGIPVDSQQLVNLVCCTQMLLRELVKCRALLVANRMEMRDFAGTPQTHSRIHRTDVSSSAKSSFCRSVSNKHITSIPRTPVQKNGCYRKIGMDVFRPFTTKKHSRVCNARKQQNTEEQFENRTYVARLFL